MSCDFDCKIIEADISLLRIVAISFSNCGICPVKYRIVYDGIAKTDDLESLYYAFQAELPEGYKGHVLSVSDVLELYDGHGSTFYYVDQIGFVQIPFEGAEPGMESCLEM